jgi:hypothetical protein
MVAAGTTGAPVAAVSSGAAGALVGGGVAAVSAGGGVWAVSESLLLNDITISYKVKINLKTYNLFKGTNSLAKSLFKKPMSRGEVPNQGGMLGSGFPSSVSIDHKISLTHRPIPNAKYINQLKKKTLVNLKYPE